MENIEIVVGTYENIILGYKVVRQIKGDLSLEASFTDDSHRGALRCMSISPNGTLVSGSTDDSIRMHSLTKRKDIGGLFEHSGTVNSLSFYGSSHMFSASEDGTMCIWKCKNWEMLRTLKGHKAHVMSLAVHPSGKLGLSVGSDKSFLTWDLVTGKLAFQRKLKDVAQNVYFTPSGNHYILVYQRIIEVCLLEDTSTVKEITTSWRINSVHFIEDDLIAIGGDSSTVLIVNVISGKTVLTLNCIKPGDSTFNSRVRCLCSTRLSEAVIIFAGMANGNVAVFKLIISEDQKDPELVLFYETKVRLTCMAVYHHKGDADKKGEKNDPQMMLEKRKKSNQNDNEDESDSQMEETQDRLSPVQTEQSAEPDKRNKSKKRKLNQSQEQETVEDGETQLKKGSQRLSRKEKHKKKLLKK